MNATPNYRLMEEVYSAGNTRVCRAVDLGDGKAVILKILSGDQLSPDSFARYQREYEITAALAEVEGVTKVFAIENVQDSVMIVQEDIGGTSLATILESGRLDLDDALALGLRVTQILGQIHRHRVIHKDFNPTNIIWNRRTGAVRVIDFGISSQLSQERAEFQGVKQLEANLAYASPEQTGRVNRALDSRSDLYSLGVTLYQLFTGTLPFLSRGGIELVHAHIALMPPPPHEVSPGIPPILSQIVMRLMAKMADDRYQSARGLEHDLQRCLDHLRDTGTIPSFPLGGRDASARLRIPQRLYGREAEIATIVEAFERSTVGETELLLVSGPSGTGKSALVHEVHRPLTERHGNFIAGKFDQYQRDVPFYAWRLAFEEFCSLLLKEDDSALERWRTRILGAVGSLGKVITEVIPSLELIIGPQDDVPPLTGEMALNRLNYVFGNFLAAVCRRDFPLVVFIDDWQWADAGSLSLLRSVMGNKALRSLLLIGAYRDNEVHAAHPFAVAVEDIRRLDARIGTISLAELRPKDVHGLVRDALNDSPGLEVVARLIHEKTRGNAFFVVQLLTDLYEKSVIRLDPETRTWTWSREEIESRHIADNVIDLMTAKIRRLPDTAQRALIHASCIGDRFELFTLAAILDLPPHQAAEDIEAALQEGILVPVGLNYRLARLPGNKADVTYQFIHDRVRQAAHGLLDKESGEHIHYGIARKWLAEMSADDTDLRIFDIANQYNASLRLVADEEERRQVLIINLTAGRRAKTATAFSTALHYFQIALDLKPARFWEVMGEVAAELYLLAAEVAFLAKDYRSMEAWIDEFLAHRPAPLDQAGALKIRLQARVAQNRLSEAVDVSLHALGLLGVRLPKTPGPLQVMANLLRTKLALRGKSLADLNALPPMTDPVRLAAMELLGLTIPPAYWTSQELMALTVFQMVRDSVAHGYSPNAGYGFSWWGITESAMLGNIDRGYDFGEFAIDLARRHQLNLQQPLFFAAWIIRKFKRPLKDTIPVFEQAYALSLEKGDFEYASYARNNHIQTLFHTGRNLGVLLPEMEQAHRDLQRFQIGSSLYWHSIWWQTALNFAEAKAEPHHLGGPAYDEAQSLPQHLKVNDASTLFLLHCAKLMLGVFFGDRESARLNAGKARTYLKGGVGMHAFTLFHFHESLALLSGETRPSGKIMRQVARNQKKLKTWADHAPMNYRYHWMLVEAERLRAAGKSDRSLRCYDQAIDLARDSDCVHEEALAYELAARCLLARRQERLASYYLRQALHLYERWGAAAKAAHLTAEFSALLLTIAPVPLQQRVSGGRSPTTSQGRPASGEGQQGRSFDFLAVTQASQAISGEIVIGKLINTLLEIVIEHSGAQKAMLIFKNGEDLSIQARGIARQTIEVDSTPMAITEWAELPLPRSMVQYVARTAKSQIIHDARQETQFSKDPYFLREKPLSVLCEPIVHQGKVVGMLYLENNLTAGAFTEERLELLRLLSSQAAISIENAILYAEMEKRVEQRTHELAESLKTVNAKSRQVSTLFNNSGQGFLSFGPDLIVESEFSQACLSFFGHSPAGHAIDQLLLPDDAHGRNTFRSCLEEALTDEDPDRRHIYLSLLPEEIAIGATTLKAEFKALDHAVMAVLTDISEEKALAAQVARERTRLEMIVAAVTSGNDFFDAVAEFESFIHHGKMAWRDRDAMALYRAIHTFKGTFNQLGFHLVPAALHKVEASLQQLAEADDLPAALATTFAPDWAALLAADLDAVSSALGADFMARRGVVAIPPHQAKRFELYARGHLDPAETPKVLAELAAIRTVSLRQSLSDYDKLIQQVCTRLEKVVLPLKLTGTDLRIDPDAWGPFLRSLGHVFRNAVDHGIESPDSRLGAGKSEFGTIACNISISDGLIGLEISDDGEGINEDSLRRRAAELGIGNAKEWNLVDLIFGDGISSRSEATDLSGRGVGMGAVRSAVEAMGGSISVRTSPGHGTTMLFSLPLPAPNGAPAP